MYVEPILLLIMCFKDSFSYRTLTYQYFTFSTNFSQFKGVGGIPKM